MPFYPASIRGRPLRSWGRCGKYFLPINFFSGEPPFSIFFLIREPLVRFLFLVEPPVSVFPLRPFESFFLYFHPPLQMINSRPLIKWLGGSLEISIHIWLKNATWRWHEPTCLWDHLKAGLNPFGLYSSMNIATKFWSCKSSCFRDMNFFLVLLV